MRKYILFFAVFFIFLLSAYAYGLEKQFEVDASVTYEVKSDGLTHVTHEVTIENLYSEFYAKNYSLSLNNIEPLNTAAFQGGQKLNVSTTKTEDTSVIKVDFEDAVIGKGAKRKFSISFDEKSFVTKTGEVWEVTIPRLASLDTFRTYNISLLIPKSLGQESYLSPDPVSSDQNPTYRIYKFDKSSVAKVGITAGFGEFQVFSFTLKYHLENPLVKNASIEIALPPDTDFQRVYYESLEPKPARLQKDFDGNWIAIYDLSPRARVDVTGKGSVQIFSEPLKGFNEGDKDLSEFLKPTKYWQSQDPRIVDLAKTYNTPKKIYDYVVGTLSYDYERVRPNVDRLGALGALDNKKSAICMEFTDLFIAIARAAGIPAREINGYAYTENPQIEPLSLVADVLHAWPQYWDENKKIWVSVDPTWGSTTGGVDFFNKLDLRHFAFVIHGTDPEKPYPAGSYKLGPNPEKDVFVSFGKLPISKVSKPEIKAEVRNIPFLKPVVLLKIENSGPLAIYNTPIDMYFDNSLTKSEKVNNLLPFSTYNSELSIPFGILALTGPEKLEVYFANSFLEVPTGKMEAIVYNLIAVALIISVIMFLILIRSKKPRFLNVKKIKKDTINQKLN